MQLSFAIWFVFEKLLFVVDQKKRAKKFEIHKNIQKKVESDRDRSEELNK